MVFGSLQLCRSTMGISLEWGTGQSSRELFTSTEHLHFDLFKSWVPNVFCLEERKNSTAKIIFGNNTLHHTQNIKTRWWINLYIDFLKHVDGISPFCIFHWTSSVYLYNQYGANVKMYHIKCFFLKKYFTNIKF